MSVSPPCSICGTVAGPCGKPPPAPNGCRVWAEPPRRPIATFDVVAPAMEKPPAPLIALGDLPPLPDVKGAALPDLSPTSRRGFIAGLLSTVWNVVVDEVGDHADDALRALADVVRGVAKGAPFPVALLGRVAAGLLDLAADHLDPTA